MLKQTILPFLLAILCIPTIGSSQEDLITAKILDSATAQPIPYVTILLSNKKGVITNQEGRFSIQLGENNTSTDSLYISCIGYKSMAHAVTEFKDSIIYLPAKAIELNDVILSNKQYTASEIIAQVKANLDKNYNKDFTKKKLFFRESYRSHLVKTDYTFIKSTIAELNKKFLDSVLRTVPKSDNRYTEVLCNLYGNYEKDSQKIDLIKASELYDKNSELDLTSLEERFNEIVKENVKPDSYFKIKSGLFGTKVGADELFESETDSTDSAALQKELEERKKREVERKSNFAKYRKSTMGRIFKNLFFMKDSDLNFIRKSGKYKFTLQEFTYLGEDAVYIVDFEPKTKADYKGRLYINSDDFAIIRVDYENVKPVRKFKLLGISMSEDLAAGKMIFAKDIDNRYTLRFMEAENGSRVGIRRPLKIIEKNKHVKGRRKQNELSVKIDMAVRGGSKFEIVIFDTDNISQAQFDGYTENNTVLPVYMPRYNPEFWKGYNIIEPNQAIKEFTAQEEAK